MNIFKKAASLLLAAVICVSAATGLSSASVADAAGTQAEQAYTPIDKNNYIRWDGKSDFKAWTNYYIDKTVSIMKKTFYTIPQTSKLVVCSGGNLQIYVGSGLTVRGELTFEPGGSMICSGTLSVAKQAGINNMGSVSLTPSSLLSLQSEFTSAASSLINCSGTVNIYKDGVLTCGGNTVIQAGSVVTTTGSVIVPSSGTMFVKGCLITTVSGKMNVTGYLSLSGEIRNSGTIDFQKEVRYYVSGAGKMLRSTSGRFNDYRVIEVEPDPAPDTSVSESETFEAKGIDVSRYQGEIDWKKVRAAGVKFAMVRLSVGVEQNGMYGQDIRSDYNITEAQKAGVEVGVYHYLLASNVEEAREEARALIKLLAKYRITYPVALDFEEPWQERELTTELRTNMARAFIDEVRAAGYYTVMYTNLNWLRNYLDMSKLSDVDIWLAHWTTSVKTYRGMAGMWQYSPQGRVSGIAGDVDLDICYVDYAKLIREGGYNHLDD